MLGLTQRGGQSPPVRDRSTESASDASGRPSGLTPIAAALDQHFAPLIRTIESEIIPRLLLAHKGAVDARCDAADERGEIPGVEQVHEFASLVLTQDASAASRYVEAMVDQGYLLETLYLDLLAPAARHLGELWEQDLCDFVDVTMALGRVQHVIREFSPVFREAADGSDAESPATRSRRILLTPAPGEQHSMGLLMVKEFFLRDGWEVVGGPGVPADEVALQVASEWFDCIGVSVGGDCRLAGLASWIGSLRAVSKNRTVSVLLGGPHFAAHPELAALFGADATAADARTAVRQAEILTARPD